MTDDAWFRGFQQGPDDGARLLCFPHAGGSASSFRPLSARLAPHAEILAVQYPGRQDRRRERPAATIEELADRIHAALSTRPDRPTALFGHSMGALVAYEVARRLDEAPAILFVSGRRAPSLRRPETSNRRDDAGLLAELKRLSGTDERLLGDEELLAMILPALRADYEALDAYRPAETAPLSCPVTALVGDADPVTSVQDAERWADHTKGPFELRVFPGGHFYLEAHADGVASAVATGLRATGVPS